MPLIGCLSFALGSFGSALSGALFVPIALAFGTQSPPCLPGLFVYFSIILWEYVVFYISIINHIAWSHHSLSTTSRGAWCWSPWRSVASVLGRSALAFPHSELSARLLSSLDALALRQVLLSVTLVCRFSGSFLEFGQFGTLPRHNSGAQSLLYRSTVILALSRSGAQPLWNSATLALNHSDAQPLWCLAISSTWLTLVLGALWPSAALALRILSRQSSGVQLL